MRFRFFRPNELAEWFDAFLSPLRLSRTAPLFFPNGEMVFNRICHNFTIAFNRVLLPGALGDPRVLSNQVHYSVLIPDGSNWPVFDSVSASTIEKKFDELFERFYLTVCAANCIDCPPLFLLIAFAMYREVVWSECQFAIDLTPFVVC